MGYIVKKIDSKDAMEIITTKHYLRRKPSISWAFGLFKEDGLTDLVGICTIGKPASNSLCKGVMGGYRLDKNGVEMIMKNKNKVVDYLFELYWNRYLYLEDMVFVNNGEGMTDEEVDSSLEEMSFIFKKVSPFVRDVLGHHEELD